MAEIEYANTRFQIAFILTIAGLDMTLFVVLR